MDGLSQRSCTHKNHQSEYADESEADSEHHLLVHLNPSRLHLETNRWWPDLGASQQPTRADRQIRHALRELDPEGRITAAHRTACYANH